MTELNLDEIAAVCAKATAGPWWVNRGEHTWQLFGVAGTIPPQTITDTLVIPEQTVSKQICKAPTEGMPFAEYWPDGPDEQLILTASWAMAEMVAELRQWHAAYGKTALPNATATMEKAAAYDKLTRGRNPVDGFGQVVPTGRVVVVPSVTDEDEPSWTLASNIVYQSWVDADDEAREVGGNAEVGTVFGPAAIMAVNAKMQEALRRPTTEAYDAACAAIEKHRARAAALAQALAELQQLVTGFRTPDLAETVNDLHGNMFTLIRNALDADVTAQESTPARPAVPAGR